MSQEPIKSDVKTVVLPSLSEEEAAAIDTAVRILEKRFMDGEKLTSAARTQKFCQLLVGGELEEHFGCLFLNAQHQLIWFEKLFRGTISSAHVHPRVVVRRALELNAAAVIFTHNHPSGISEPSDADYGITRKLKESLEIIDVRVLDHIVVSAGGSVSMAQKGRL